MKPWLRRGVRAATIVVMAIATIVAVAVVSSLTIDLGPSLRARAEREGSRYLRRPLHIGTLSIRLLSGEFVVDDVLIEGLTTKDRPFLKAKRIAVRMSWLPLWSNEIFVDSVTMTDWTMAIETFPGGRHSMPRLMPERREGARSRFRTTVQYVNATRGEFTYDDHTTPWRTVARNLDVTITKVLGYRGQASFSGGTVRIQSYEPMWADMRAQFTIEGSRVHFDRIDLTTDGAESVLTGDADLPRWPEQVYRVTSRVHFPRMRELFFARETFSLFGDGAFTGTFHMYKGGRTLKGSFASDLAGVNAYRFSDLRGSLAWLPDRFDVTDARCGFYGGRARFTYGMAPLGQPTPAIARFDASYEDVDLATFTDFLQTEGLRLDGRASGRNLLVWPLGRFAARRGGGTIQARPPAGVRVLDRVIPSDLLSEEDRLGREIGPFAPHPLLGHVPVGGELTYAFDPEWLQVAAGRLSTTRTHVEFSGRTAYGSRSRFPFRVVSADWQESDRLLARLLTAFGSRTRAVPVGGHGAFDGVMVGEFQRPRIEGRFEGDRLRAFDVEWGTGAAAVVIENAYAEVTGGWVTADTSRIDVDGRFSLGYPRRDGGEEINARIRVDRRPIRDLRHAFALDDYDLDGRLSGEFHLEGKYQTPLGFGKMRIDDGVAYTEPFGVATAGLRFEGQGVRLDRIDIVKGSGRMTGAAFVSWEGTYSFDADGHRVPVESIAAAAYPRAPLSGSLTFAASGSGAFENPRYEVKGRIDDLFVADEGIGQVTGRLDVRNDVMTVELEAASPRLAVSGSGRIALDPEADAELTFRFVDTSLDPYVRAFEPRLSPFTRAVASGSFRVVGELANIDQLLVDGAVEQLDLSLFDYRLRNDGPVRLALDRHSVRVDRMRLAGEGTALDVTGEVGLHDERIALTANGDANLGILQGFFRDLRSSGNASVVAEVRGPLRTPVFSGSATIANGRIRHFSLPHSLEGVNGKVSFDAGGLRVDDLTGRLGGGDVRFSGRIGLKGYRLGELSLAAVGEEMRLRYPEGFRSTVNADLALQGDAYNPLLTGTVTVADAVWVRSFEAEPGLFQLAGVGGPGAPAPAAPTTLPLRFDVRIVAPSALRIESSTARIVSSADLTLRGTYDRPLLFGRADLDRGEVFFEGNRYRVTRGTIDFANPTRIEPFFDVEAETLVRVPSQTYRINLHIVGTPARLVPDISSDPPLPTVDILGLLFGDIRDPLSAEFRALRQPGAAQTELLTARAARLLASPISTEVGRVVQQTFGVDTVQITPSLIDPSAQQSSRLNPTARLTIGKRISERVFLTFSRALSASSRDQIILLEYNQSDRLSWILSQNEDRTYALDFRVRHAF